MASWWPKWCDSSLDPLGPGGHIGAGRLFHGNRFRDRSKAKDRESWISTNPGRKGIGNHSLRRQVIELRIVGPMPRSHDDLWSRVRTTVTYSCREREGERS